MSIFAIGDLHLPGGDDKSMAVFGPQWENHWEKIAADWQERVHQQDIVLIPGDISWAMHLEDALPDLQMIGAMPGRKVILRGNHDYWWGAITRVRESLPDGMFALQNDAVVLGGVAFCGSRGWLYPGEGTEGEDARIYARELIRMRLSLERARSLLPEGPIVVMTHFPPLGEGGMTTPMSELIESFGVNDVVYAHLHGQAVKSAYTGTRNGGRYHFTSWDGLAFNLYKLP